MTYTGGTLYNSAPGTSNTTLWTSEAGAGIRQILAVNSDSSAHTVTLTLVRKGGSATDAYAVVIAQAVSVPANGVAELLDPRLHSALDEMQCFAGDSLYGLASSSDITVLVYGSGS